MGVLRAALCLVALLLSPGCCLMLGNYQTARTPEKGVSEVGLTVGVTTYQIESKTYEDENDDGDFDDPGEEKDETVSVAWPALIPEIPFHVGVTDDVAIGGRIAPSSLGLEGDVRWRFLHADRLHMAIAPAVNYQAWLIVAGYGGRLPLLVTYDVADNFSITTSVFGAHTVWEFADEEFDPDDEDERGTAVWDGGVTSFGGSFGMEIRGESFFIRPAVEMTRYAARSGDENPFWEPFTSYGVVLSIGWLVGKTKKQLDRIEQKIDRLSPQPPPPPSPPPPPNEEGSLSKQSRWLPTGRDDDDLVGPPLP